MQHSATDMRRNDDRHSANSGADLGIDEPPVRTHAAAIITPREVTFKVGSVKPVEKHLDGVGAHDYKHERILGDEATRAPRSSHSQ